MSGLSGDVESAARASLANIGVSIPERAQRLPTELPPEEPILPRGIRIGVHVAAVVFAAGALFQVLALAWLGLFAILGGAASELLVHGHAMELGRFGSCSLAAFGVVGLLYAVIAVVVVQQRRREAAIAKRSKRGSQAAIVIPRRWIERHPVISAGALLGAALVVAVLASWDADRHYAIATTIVLANAYYFALAGVLGSLRLSDWLWHRVRTWGFVTAGRALFLAASLAFLGLVGGVALATGYYRGNAHVERDLDELAQAPGVMSMQLRAFCIVADDLDPGMTRDADIAPACEFLNARVPDPPSQ